MIIKLGAALAALRSRHWHYCQCCEKRFSAIKTAKFCSNRCKQQNKNEQKKQKAVA